MNGSRLNAAAARSRAAERETGSATDCRLSRSRPTRPQLKKIGPLRGGRAPLIGQDFMVGVRVEMMSGAGEEWRSLFFHYWRFFWLRRGF